MVLGNHSSQSQVYCVQPGAPTVLLLTSDPSSQGPFCFCRVFMCLSKLLTTSHVLQDEREFISSDIPGPCPGRTIHAPSASRAWLHIPRSVLSVLSLWFPSGSSLRADSSLSLLLGEKSKPTHEAPMSLNLKNPRRRQQPSQSLYPQRRPG